MGPPLDLENLITVSDGSVLEKPAPTAARLEEEARWQSRDGGSTERAEKINGRGKCLGGSRRAKTKTRRRLKWRACRGNLNPETCWEPFQKAP